MEFKEKQLEFLKKFKEGDNIFLSGKAGTGKSTIVNEAIKWAEANKKNVAKLAPTGVAANNIGGQTIHSFFKLPFGEEITLKNTRVPKDETIDILNATDIFIIDEVSMLRPDVLQSCFWTMFKGKVHDYLGKQFIFVGDLAQLEAVIKDEELNTLIDRFGGTKFHDAMDFPTLEVDTIELDEIVRQSDNEFIDALNEIREGRTSDYFKQFTTKEAKGIILAPYNKVVDTYNKIGLDKHPGTPEVFQNKAFGRAYLKDFDLPETITLKEGCKIMCMINNSNTGIFNGAIGTYTKTAIEKWDEAKGRKVSEPCPGIKLENGRVVPLPAYKYEKKEYVKGKDGNLEQKVIGHVLGYPIKLAYALSIHKSQGLTFEEITVDLKKPCFAEGQLYTALSRVKTPQGLNLIIK